MGNIYRLSGGVKRIDVPENHLKNRLPIGTVLQLNGYDNPRFCIIKNLGITPGFESYGTKYQVINIETGQESIKDALSLDHISKKDVEIRGIHVYFTDKVLDPEEIMDLVNKAEAKKKSDIKAKAETDQARALELDTLKRDYTHLEPVAGNKRSTYAVGAANIRKELKAAFPHIKFSVTSEGYSMGCSINVSWVDAVTTEEVERIINKYEYGTFDSMTDCAGSIDSQFIDLYGGARFVKANRHLSDDAYNKVAVTMGYPQAIFNPRQGGFDGVDYEISQMIKREAWKTKF
jgi:hypothetical protein